MIIAYLRVSTDEQARSGLGMDAQLDAIQKAVGIVQSVYRDEGYSGSNPKRPALHQALSALDKGDILAVAKRDRLSRDMMLALWIEKEAKRRGAKIVSAAGEGTESEEPTAVLMRRIVDAFAEYEKNVIGARTAAALEQKRARGEKTGGDVPFGWMLEATERHIDVHSTTKKLQPHREEQEALKLMRDLHAEGLSLRKIGAELESRGVKTKTGKTRWNPNSIKQVLEAKQAA
jgi:DNA invertase Pin-like site-specific DNA recombinase